MRRRLCLVGRKIAAEEQPAMDHRVQRFDPAVEHFRKTGMLGDILHLQARLAQGRGRPAGREHFHPGGSQPPGEFDQTGFVGDRKKGAADFHGAKDTSRPFPLGKP